MDVGADGSALLVGGVVVFVAAFLGGVTGFGYGLVSAPLLLLIGFPLRFVVTANLTLGGLTRVGVAYRFRRYVSARRSVMLAAGSAPGLFLGAEFLSGTAETVVKLLAGVVTMVAAALLARSLDHPPPRPVPGAPILAGFVGGFLGSATSLSGIGPILLLARDKASPVTFMADLAVFFTWTSALGLLLLWRSDVIAPDALYPAVLLWLPGSLAGNLLGTSLAPRLPERLFRRLTLGVIFAAGAVTAVTA
jgi:uncharacterized membrane protein YfcA